MRRTFQFDQTGVGEDQRSWIIRIANKAELSSTKPPPYPPPEYRWREKKAVARGKSFDQGGSAGASPSRSVRSAPQPVEKSFDQTPSLRPPPEIPGEGNGENMGA